MNEVINSCLTALNSIGSGFCDYTAGIFVQSSVLIVLLLIVDFLLRKRVRAVFRYCVWMLVFVKLILPPTLSLPTGIGYWYGDYLSADSPVLQQVSNVVRPEPAGTPAPEDFALSAEIPQDQPSQTNPQIAAPVTSGVSGLNALTWQAVVFLLWLVGVLVISVLLIRRMLFVKGLIAQSEPAKNRLVDVLNQCRRQVGIGHNMDTYASNRRIELRLSSNISAPAVCGLFKPVILIPTSLVEKLSPDRLRAVLVHELVHIKRADIWVNLVQTVLQIIYFYNPFVWLANAVVRRIREQAVDEMVLVALGAGAKSYSNTLIDIAEMAFWKTSLSLRLIGVVESKKALHRRIKHMLNRPIPKNAKLGTFGLLVVIITGAILLPMSKASKDKEVAVEEDVSNESQFIATLPNGVTVEMFGLCEHPSEDEQWWRPDGTMIEDDFRPYAFKELRSLRLPSNQQENKILELAVKITDSSNRNVGMICGGANRTFVNCRNNVWGGTVEVGKEPEVKDFKIGVAVETWETVASSESKFGRRRRKTPGIVFTEAYNTQKGYAVVIVTHKKDIQKENWRVVAIDKEGKPHRADLYQTQGIGEFEQNMFHFKGLRSEQIRRFEFQTRPYQWAEFKNVSLQPGFKTDVQTKDRKKAAQESKTFKATLPNYVTVELLGLGKKPWEAEQQWWRPDGVEIEKPEYKTNGPPFKWPTNPNGLQFQCAALSKFSNHQGKNVSVPEVRFSKKFLQDGLTSGIAADETQITYIVRPPNKGVFAQQVYQKTDILLAIGSVPFKKAKTPSKKFNEKMHETYFLEDNSEVIRHPLRIDHYLDTLTVDLTCPEGDFEFRVIAEFKNGQTEQWQSGGSVGKKVRFFHATPRRENIKVEDIEQLIIEYRPYDWVTFRNVSLQPGFKTDVQVEVELEKPTEQVQGEGGAGKQLSSGGGYQNLSREQRERLERLRANRQSLSYKNMQKLGLAVAVFANDHNGRCPSNLSDLRRYIGDEQIFDWINQNVVYLGKNQEYRAPPDAVLAYDESMLKKPRQETNVLYNDAHVALVSSKWLKELGIRLER